MTLALSGTPQGATGAAPSIVTTGAGKFVTLFVYVTGGGSATGVTSSNITWDAAPRVGAVTVSSAKVTVFTGVATSAATATATVTTTGTATTVFCAWQEMTTTVGYSSLVLEGSPGTGTGATFPSLTPLALGRAYVGVANDAAANDSVGTTPGFTYGSLQAGTYIMAVNPSCSVAATSPAVTGSDSLASIAILLKEAVVTATTFPTLVTTNSANVRKALTGGLIVGPMSATIPTALTAGTPPALQSLTGWTGSMGLFLDTGAVFAETVNSADITAWGQGDPARTDITSKKLTLQVAALETNKTVLSTYFGVDPATLTPDPTTGELHVDQTSNLATAYYRMLVISQDGAPGSEYWIARLLPKASITNFGNMVFMSGASAIVYDITLTAYADAAAGFTCRNIYSGPGWLANKTAAGF